MFQKKQNPPIKMDLWECEINPPYRWVPPTWHKRGQEDSGTSQSREPCSLQWRFSVEVRRETVLPTKRTLGRIQRHPWLSQPGAWCCWHLVGRGQRCCPRVQCPGLPLTTQNVNSSEQATFWSREREAHGDRVFLFQASHHNVQPVWGVLRSRETPVGYAGVGCEGQTSR